MAPEVTVAYDITFYSADDEELQPRSGYEVDVTFTVAPESVLLAGEAQELQAFHVSNDMVAQPVGDIVEIVPADSETAVISDEPVEVAVKATEFSIYVVSSISDTSTSGTKIADGGSVTYTLVQDINKNDPLYFYSNTNVKSDYWVGRSLKRSVTTNHSWTSNNPDVATVTHVNNGNVEITVHGAGTVKITHNYMYHTETWYLRNGWQSDNNDTSATESFTLVINPAPAGSELSVSDSIPTCAQAFPLVLT